MSDFEQNNKVTSELISGLLQNQRYNGVSYSNLQMYGQNISEEVDRECLVNPYSISAYWPGGIPALGDTQFGTYLLNQVDSHAAYSRISEIRTIILSLELSKRAMKRWAAVTETNDSFRRPDGLAIDDTYMPMACGLSEVPLGAVVLSEVKRHRKIKAGQTVAHLYFPTMMRDPRIALHELKATQKLTIESEKI